MRTIERATSFKRDYKRESKGQHRTILDTTLVPVLLALANDQELPQHLRDHDLTGNWRGFRECHLKPDLLLIYRTLDTEEGKLLQLARLGSHSELFG
jgi:mRNA interferase YafQ